VVRLVHAKPDTRGKPAAAPSIRQAAEFHGVDQKTIRRWIAQGRLTAQRIGPRLIRLDREEILSLGRRIGGAA
jgi:excisionase family DNA binding protein